MKRLPKELKEKICKVLEHYYKAGEVCVYLKNHKQEMLESIKPHFHKSEVIGWERRQDAKNMIIYNKRRYRFIILSENNWNYIKLTELERKHIVEECKQLLDAYNIKYEEVTLGSYHPYIDSRPEYAPWNTCLDITSLEFYNRVPLKDYKEL